jgi:hypothetical protein
VSTSTQSDVNTTPIQLFPSIALASPLSRFIVSDDILSYRAMDGQYVRDGEGFILVYSITSRASFEETSKFHQQILQIKGKGNFSTVLVGNKRDLEHERQVGVKGE